MDIEIDDKSGLIKFALNEKDIQDAREIYAMMESKGWKILRDYYAVARESLIDKCKESIKTDDELASKKRCAVLSGFDDCATLPTRVVLRAEQYVAKMKKKQEEQLHDGSNDGE